MNVRISFDYITSEWTVEYTEGNKTNIVGSGRTLIAALDNLQNKELKNQIMLWYGMEMRKLL
jgi:hypothetical protein